MAVVDEAAKAYHAERLALRVLKYAARAHAQYFLRVFAPEIAEEASRIVDDAVMSAEVALLGWTEEEAAQARGQAFLSIDHGGHDMQPRSDDRNLLHLAAWLESMEDDEAPDGPPHAMDGGTRTFAFCNVTRDAVLGHPSLAPRLESTCTLARVSRTQRCRTRWRNSSMKAWTVTEAQRQFRRDR